MPEPLFDDIARQLADLGEQPETSFALRTYLRSAANRDIVDVMNEIDILTKTVDAAAMSLARGKWPE